MDITLQTFPLPHRKKRLIFFLSLLIPTDVYCEIYLDIQSMSKPLYKYYNKYNIHYKKPS